MARPWLHTERRAHPGWTVFRVAHALCALATWLPRGWHLPDNYSAAGVAVERSALPLTRWVVFSEPTAWAVWGLAILGWLALLTGRANRPALLLATTCAWALNFHEGLNFKAYDRLMFWQAVVLLLSPGGGDGRRPSEGNARYALLLVYCGLYGSTGWMKMLVEPHWRGGEVLRYALFHADFGLRPVGVWLASMPTLLMVSGWMAVSFEVLFPLLCWFRWTRAVLLLVAFGFHVVVFASMHVNTFSLIAVAAWPVLLDAGQWRWVTEHVGPRLRVSALVLAGAWALAIAAPWAAEHTWGPRTEAPWRAPDKAVRARVAAWIEGLTESAGMETTPGAGGTAEEARTAATLAWARARLAAAGCAPSPGEDALELPGEGGWRLAAHLERAPGSPGADETVSALAVAGAVAEAGCGRGGVPGVVLFVGAPPEDASHTTLRLDAVGRIGRGRGSQGWPDPWAWWLTSVGDFWGVAAAPGSEPAAGALLGHLRTHSPVPTLALPGHPSGGTLAWAGHTGPLRPGVVLLTDTARLRAPDVGRPEDAPDKLDRDALTWLAEALATLR